METQNTIDENTKAETGTVDSGIEDTQVKAKMFSVKNNVFESIEADHAQGMGIQESE